MASEPTDDALIEAMADEIAWAIGEPLHSRSPGMMLAAQRALAAIRKTHAVVPLAVLEAPFNMNEIVELGRAIFPHINSEKTTNVGAISHDAAWAARKIFTDRIAASEEDSDGR